MYVIDLLSESGLLGAKSVDTPLDPNRKFHKYNGEVLDEPEKY